MEGTLEDFLSLFRLRQVALKRESIDMRAMVAEVVAAMQKQYPRASQISVGPLPRVNGDRGLIRQVWVNLLVYAVKFTGCRDAPKITIEATPTQLGGRDMIEFRVADNGVGFDRASAGHLFELFHR